jgi:hypothetical protein
MDTNVLQYLPYLLLTAGGVLGAIGVIVVSLLKSEWSGKIFGNVAGCLPDNFSHLF